MFDGPIDLDDGDAALRAPLAVPTGDKTRFVGTGTVRHLGRWRRCGYHAVTHRAGPGGCWTHLYRVLAERGGGRLVLLCRASPGDGGEDAVPP